ncbi:hypothetical protein SBOR_9649 [Sclerotinia borealis F-4128]|uniref:Rhodopsin domain-containing protein n=1 Tax=Sclerotinia borealis (strain F-4128) TaxID=1432307 RepID=W9C4X5_SCLBF|nr:hypothetical protein SBOR_9649 [Sclerotinia borealis F-4128]
MAFVHHPNAVSPGYVTYDIVACILTFIATICVVLRFIHRSRTKDYMLDDWAILLSLIFDIGVLIGTLLISAPSVSGAGYHITAYTIPELNMYFKLALASNVLYNMLVNASKASILLFYRRIFSVDRQYLVFMRFMAVIIPLNCLAAVCGLIFSTNPVRAQWNVGMPHSSMNDRLFWTIMAVVNILLDILILGIALVKVWNLHMSWRRKAITSTVFLLGGLCYYHYKHPADYLSIDDTLTEAGIWTNVETNLSIICACAPVLYKFFRDNNSNERAASNQSSGWRPRKLIGTLVTIGSAPAKVKDSGFQDSTDHTIFETDGETHSMEPLAPIHVRKEYQIK